RARLMSCVLIYRALHNVASLRRPCPQRNIIADVKPGRKNTVATLKNKFARVALTIRSGTDAYQENISNAGATLGLKLCMRLVCGAYPVSWLRFSKLWILRHKAWVRFVSFVVVPGSSSFRAAAR